MKKILSFLLVVSLLISTAAALADPITIDGLSNRKIKINEAGLNPSAEETIDAGYSPTTGRKLSEIEFVSDGFLGTSVTGIYQPIMVQITNAGGGSGENKKKQPTTAPINANYADVIYESCIDSTKQSGGSITRFTMVFSDIVPDYVGFVRSTRMTHCRIRQEWNAPFITSGYSPADVPDEWRRLLGAQADNKDDYENYLNPNSTKRDESSPGLIYVQNKSSRFWTKYMFHMKGIADANDHVYQLANILQNVVPKYYKYDKDSKEYKYYAPYNHTWKFTDEVPTGGDEAKFIFVSFGDKKNTDSRLEYDADTNTYYRVIWNGKVDVPYRTQIVRNPEINPVNVNGERIKMVTYAGREWGETITFSNVIIQGIKMNWIDSDRPDPTMTGTGNADYFMCGKHYTGVWQRKDYNSRTVFYGEDGNEIELQRGKTLIILMDYGNTGREVKYDVAFE